MHLFKSLRVFLPALLLSSSVFAQVPSKAIEDVSELGLEIDNIREKTKAAGIAVAMINADGKLWVHNSGMAILAEKKPVKSNTQFRFGSISKMFVSLSIIKLVEQNKLDLNARLADVAPEIEFDNPWEQTDPIRIVHLLNHSTGWDAPHFVEQRAWQTTPISVRQALDLHPHSRHSRWLPGSRSAYNNTGPLVAAYVVEKIADIRFEDYVHQQFLGPLKMDSSGYFDTERYRQHAATLYRGQQPLPYLHLNNRAAGGFNSSTADMAKFLRLMLQRGNNQDVSILPISALEQLERPQGTLATDAGLYHTWGLGNTVFHANGILFHGHEGSLPGANAVLAYQPELGVGYVAVSNTEGPAIGLIHKMLSNYLTQGIKKKKVTADRNLTDNDFALTGLYRNISPVSDISVFFTQLLPWSLKVSESEVEIKPLIGAPARHLVAGDINNYKQNSTGKIALARVTDPIAGEVLHYGPMTLVKINAISAYLPLIILALWILLGVVSVLFSLIWLPRKWLGRISNPDSIKIRSWPLMTFFIVLISLIGTMIIRNSTRPFELAGQPTPLSIVVFLSTIAFFLGYIWSVKVWFETKAQPMNSFVKWHSTLMIFLNLTVGLYCLAHGIIGIRLWA